MKRTLMAVLLSLLTGGCVSLDTSQEFSDLGDSKERQFLASPDSRLSDGPDFRPEEFDPESAEVPPPTREDSLRLLVPASLKATSESESQRIRGIIRAHNSEVLDCWETFPSANKVKGKEKVTLNFGINSQGRVANLSLESDRFPQSALHLKCVVRKIRNMAFPPRTGRDTLLVTHVFRYSFR